MSFGIVTRNQNPLLYREGLLENFWEDFNYYPDEYTRFLKTSSVDTPEVAMSRIAGPARLYRSDDGQAPVFETIDMGDKVLATDREYQGGYGVTRKALEDDKYGKLNQGAKHLGHASKMTLEYRGADFLNDAFTGTTFKGCDGLALLSTAHTLLRSSSTVSNKAATPVGFSFAGVTALLDLAGKMKDENGDPVIVKLTDCIIPNEQGLIQDAMKIFGQAAEPGTATNDENMVKQQLGTITPMVSHYMSSASNYFMYDSRLNDAHFRTRVALNIWDWDEKSTGTKFVAARIRFMQYFFQYRGWYGANPS